MAATPKQVILFYGNQSLSVEKSAEKMIDKVLGDAPRDFALHRFDAREILSPGSSAGESTLEAFLLACHSMPFLCERYVVRLDHAELVRAPAQAVAKATQALAALTVFPLVWEGETVWALEEHLPPGVHRGEGRFVSDWVVELSAAPGGGCLLELGGENPRFLMPKGEERHLLTLKQFLRDRISGKVYFGDEEADLSQERGQGSVAAQLHHALEKLVANPPPDCYLIFTAKAEREKDISSRLLKTIKQHGQVEKFITYDDYNPVDWVMEEARKRKFTLDKPAAGLLVHLIGNDLAHLASELEKLSLLLPEGARPNESELLGMLHDHRRFSPFFLAEKLGHRDLDGALSVLDQFLVNSPHEHPILIGIMARHFRQLLQVHALRKLGANDQEMASHLKLHPFIAKRVIGQAGQFGPGELEKILIALAGLDVELKRHTHLTTVLLKDLVMGICLRNFPGGDPARGLRRVV